MQYSKNHYIDITVHASGVILVDENKKVLLVQEKEKEKCDLWNIPSGRVNENETPLHALHRETWEETNYILRNPKYLNTYVGYLEDKSIISRHIWVSKFDKFQSINPKLNTEIKNCAFFSYQEILVMFESQNIRMFHIKDAIEKALKFINNVEFTF